MAFLGKDILMGSVQLSSVSRNILLYLRSLINWQEKNRKIGFKFRQLLVANVTAFSKISEKEDNLAKYTQIFENFSESFLSTQLCPRNFYNFRLNGSHFGNSTVFGFSGNFSPFAAICKFSKVSVEWKAPFTLGSGSRM